MNSSSEYLHSELPAIDLFWKMGYRYYECIVFILRNQINYPGLQAGVIDFLPECEKNRRKQP